VASAFESPLDVFKKAYEHECKVTASIKNIYEVAGNEKDYATQVMLHWFLEEQVEEEKNATDVIDMLERVGSSGQGLLMADRQLGAR
jgi:ferritin